MDDSLKHLSLQFQFWSAVSAIPCLERVVSRLENRVLRDVAKVDGKAFDKSKPVDYRFIGDQTSAVSCNLVALLIVVISTSPYSPHVRRRTNHRFISGSQTLQHHSGVFLVL